MRIILTFFLVVALTCAVLAGCMVGIKESVSPGITMIDSGRAHHYVPASSSYGFGGANAISNS